MIQKQLLRVGLVIVAFGGFASSTVRAQSLHEARPPSGWRQDKGLANEVVMRQSPTSPGFEGYLRDAKPIATARAFVAPGNTAVYYELTMVAEPVPGRGPLTSLADVVQTFRTGSGDGVLTSQTLGVDNAIVDLQVEVSYLDLGTRQRARLLAYATSAGAPRVIRIECMLRETASAQVRSQCDNALASVEIQPSQRYPFEKSQLLAELRRIAGASGNVDAAASADAASGKEQGVLSGGGEERSSQRQPQSVKRPSGAPASSGSSRYLWFIVIGVVILIVGIVIKRRERDASHEPEGAVDSDAGERDRAAGESDRVSSEVTDEE